MNAWQRRNRALLLGQYRRMRLHGWTRAASRAEIGPSLQWFAEHTAP